MGNVRFRGPAYETARVKLARIRMDGAEERSQVLHHLACVAAETSGMARVGIFCLSGRDRLVLQCCCDRQSRDRRTEFAGQVSRLPTIQRVLEAGRVALLDVSDRASGLGELLDGYLLPGGIVELQSAPIVRNGRAVGLVTFERRSTSPDFHSENIGFLTSIAELSALTLAQAEKLELEAALNARAHMNQEAIKMEALVRLARSVAHDINGLLTMVCAAADQLEDADRDELRRRSVQLDEVADLCSKLTGQLFTFSGEAEVAGSVDARACIESSRALLESRFDSARTLACEYPLEGGHVRCDEVVLQRILMNLVHNARESLGPEGCVTVRLREPNLDDALTVNALVIEVVDNGCGMDEETQARAAEPYFTTKKGDASIHGLGLSSVIGLAQSCGGGVRLISERGRGTSVAVALPLVG